MRQLAKLLLILCLATSARVTVTRDSVLRELDNSAGLKLNHTKHKNIYQIFSFNTNLIL